MNQNGTTERFNNAPQKRIERRRFRRVPAAFDVKFRSDDTMFACRALDVSPMGMLLKTPPCDPPAGKIYLVFNIPGVTNRPARAIGKIVRAENARDGSKKLGISFEAMMDEVRVSLCEYIARTQAMYQNSPATGV
jgi:hypothetical protein